MGLKDILYKPVDLPSQLIESLIPKHVVKNERVRKALAYAVVGDLLVSPIPSPLDLPLDVMVQQRLRELLPEMDEGIRLLSSVSEYLPVVELLPNYILSVVVTVATGKLKESE
jgi:hypothetical protein